MKKISAEEIKALEDANAKNLDTEIVPPPGIPVSVYLFLYIVLIPTIFATFYYSFVASDIYISLAKYAVRTNAETPGISGLLDSVFSSSTGGGGSVTTSEDAFIVNDYVLSLDMLRELDKRLDIRKHYESKLIDPFTRLDIEASEEEFFEYYQNMVEVTVDTETKITTLEVRAFDPNYAHLVATNIIDLSEDLVNSISNRIISDTLQFAKDEVDNSEERVRLASLKITKFRSLNRSIDPGQETSAVMGIVTQLETQLAGARAELIEARSFMGNSTPQVKILESKVSALEKQVMKERQRLASEVDGTVDFTKLIDDYEPLILEQELAKQRYASTLTSLELARAEAQRKQRYLLTFVQPHIPDEALEPERLNSVLIIFIGFFVIYSIGGLFWAAIKDHMRV